MSASRISVGRRRIFRRDGRPAAAPQATDHPGTFVGNDPLLDIRNTRDVKRVMRGGRMFTVADLIKR